MSDPLQNEMKKLQEFKNILNNLPLEEQTSQTRFYLQADISKMGKRLANSCTLDSWRRFNAVVRDVSIPGTLVREPRLTTNARIIIKCILKLALRGLASDGRIIGNLEYNRVYVGNDLDVWVADAHYQLWERVNKPRFKLDYIKKIGNTIKRFVFGQTDGSQAPKDIKMLIDYLCGLTRFDDFNPKIVLCHPSLLCHRRLMLQAEYIYFHMMHELELGGIRIYPYRPLSGVFYQKVANEFQQYPYTDLRDLNDTWMTRARPNLRMRHLHDSVRRLGDHAICRSVFGYLLVMKHGVKHLVDPESVVGTGAGTISQEDADNYLYAMYPEYMCILTRILIEKNLLPDCWQLHGSP